MTTSTIDSWLAAVLARGALLSITWLLANALLTQASAARKVAWLRAGVLGMLLLTAFPWNSVQWWIPFRLAPSTNPIPVEPTSAIPLSTLELSPIVEQAKSATINPWVSAWFIGTFVLLTRLALSHRRVTHLIREATEESNARVLELVAAEQHSLGRSGRIVVKRHPLISTPLAAGWLRTVIILPETKAAENSEVLRITLRHEIAHLVRCDVRWQLLSELAVAVHWPNPFAWLMGRKLRLGHEAAADDSVLAGGTDRSTYADLLLTLAKTRCHSTREAFITSIARPSTLRQRIALLLDGNRRRDSAGPVLRTTVVVTAAVIVTTLGLTGLRAQVGSSEISQVERQQNLTRQYRYTFRLEPVFAKRFPDSEAAALDALQKMIAKAGIGLSESTKLELSPDKSLLTINFTDIDRTIVEESLTKAMVREGWWQKSAQVLDQLRTELDKQKVYTAKTRAEMAKILDTEEISDPDPESFNSIITPADRHIVQLERQVAEQRLRVKSKQAQLDIIIDEKPQNMWEVMRILQIDDPTVSKVVTSYHEATAREAALAAAGKPESGTERKIARATKESYFNSMGDMLGAVKSNQAKFVASERKRLIELEKELAESEDKQKADKAHVDSYVHAKTRYLQARRIREAIEKKVQSEEHPRNQPDR